MADQALEGVEEAIELAERGAYKPEYLYYKGGLLKIDRGRYKHLTVKVVTETSSTLTMGGKS